MCGSVTMISICMAKAVCVSIMTILGSLGSAWIFYNDLYMAGQCGSLS